MQKISKNCEINYYIYISFSSPRDVISDIKFKELNFVIKFDNETLWRNREKNEIFYIMFNLFFVNISMIFTRESIY